MFKRNVKIFVKAKLKNTKKNCGVKNSKVGGNNMNSPENRQDYVFKNNLERKKFF